MLSMAARLFKNKDDDAADGERGERVPLYKARVADLGPRDAVKVTCFACGHEDLIPPSTLQSRPDLSPNTRVLELDRRVRCRECSAIGEALVSVAWG